MSAQNEFQVTLSDFSGPLDLLCHLVESREIDASEVRLTDVLSQYIAFVLSTERATLAETAEFFSLASRLLLRKVRALLPGQEQEEANDAAPEDDDSLIDSELTEEQLYELLERFKPYRNMALRLGEMQREQERHFVRIADDNGPPWYDIGDLHGLATLWWQLMEDRRRRGASSAREQFLQDIPDAVPEEILVELRMEQIMEYLRAGTALRLSTLTREFGGGSLIVTLLALLELSRLQRINLAQDDAWEDIAVAVA